MPAAMTLVNALRTQLLAKMTDLFHPNLQTRSMPETRVGVALSLIVCTTASSSRTARPRSVKLALAAAVSFGTSVITPGVKHMFAWQASGPWAIHVLEVSRACNAIWEARQAGRHWPGRATPTALGSKTLAAINASFFALPPAFRSVYRSARRAAGNTTAIGRFCYSIVGQPMLASLHARQNHQWCGAGRRCVPRAGRSRHR